MRNLVSLAAGIVRQHSLDRTFYIYDMNAVDIAVRAWRSWMPDVRPFYAVKCNPDTRVMKMLHEAGSGFDCASTREFKAALHAGADVSNDIVFAHPCKHPKDIARAESMGVSLTTVDNVHEVAKLRGGAMSALLRILVPARPDGVKAARIDLGMKYGADHRTEAPAIIDAASATGLRLVGASFHVGSSCSDPTAFERAIGAAAAVRAAMLSKGHRFDILDIGGGFGSQLPLSTVGPVVGSAIKDHQFENMVRVIAEPGRFFVESAATVVTRIIGKRVRPGIVDYFITDGLYGSFNCVLYDGQAPHEPVPIRMMMLHVHDDDDDVTLRRTTTINIWGPTCDSADCVLRGADSLPDDLDVGDWLAFPKAGAYTISGARDFNGIPMASPKRFYVDSVHESTNMRCRLLASTL